MVLLNFPWNPLHNTQYNPDSKKKKKEKKRKVGTVKEQNVIIYLY